MLTIYQIYCKDPEITDCYIGSTKDYKKRIIAHKSVCNNEKRHDYDYLIYKFIRENGGFENWDFKILNQIEYYEELRAMQEQAYITLIKPSLNTLKANSDTKEWREKYYNDNKDKILEKAKERYSDNKDKILEKAKGYYEDNKDKILEKAKEKYNDNKDKILEQKKGYYDKNKEIINEKQRERRKKARENIN